MQLLPKKWLKKNGESGVMQSGGDRGLSRFRDEMDRAFDRVWRQFDRDPFSALTDASNWPSLDMAEDEKSVMLRADVPGLGPEDVTVEVSGNVLTIRGSRKDEWSEEKHGVHRRERTFGSFSRTVTLPTYVDADRIEAKYEKGILRITIPKVPGKGPKRVKVVA